jgi:predicted transcriptional regulator
VQFASLEAGAKLLSAKSRALLRAIAERQPKSVAELAAMTARAEQNVLRTLKKLETAGAVRLDKGEGRARRPVLAARKVRPATRWACRWLEQEATARASRP